MLQPIEWRIVLIDDEQDIRYVVSLTLRDTGYEVFTAEDGKPGLNLCIEKTSNSHNRYQNDRH